MIGALGMIALVTVSNALAEPGSRTPSQPLWQRGGDISWHAPVDGGTPRDPACLERLPSREFIVRALAEEGKSPLTHAVSRVELLCRNEGKQAEEVVVRFDLSDGGKRTNQNKTPFGGMRERDFIFVQSPGKPWRQVSGRVAGWQCVVRFAAEPGETRIGLSPWYGYGDYLKFVGSLPAHPHLTKRHAGTSDGGRQHWELRVTDPGVPDAGKKHVFWHAREHAYESFSSYSMEGLLDYLLSDEASDYRRRFVFTVHPMSNVDGVALGYEYRGGYDYPDPRGTASGRLVFDSLDRIRPDYVVAWHNWIAPRDVDCLFYTDGVNGKPSRRGWDLFTQFFPSPRAKAHRWEDEAYPERKNWFGRQLSESNAHQYSMKRYGTAVWGWEMPWWNRTVDNARRAGADFARAFLLTWAKSQTPYQAPEETPPIQVSQWQSHEFVLRGDPRERNPYCDAALVGHFTSPAGRTITAEGFYDGDETWRLRFSPNLSGRWRYVLRGEGVGLYQAGSLDCTAPVTRGFLTIHPQNPYAFAYSDGTPFFPMGDTCYGLQNESTITEPLRHLYLQTGRQQHFNFVRMHGQHSPSHGRKDPDYWPWEGSADRPNFDRYNPRYFRRLDGLFDKMHAIGMNAELILLNYYIAPMQSAQSWNAEREWAWLRYIVARYAAYPNLFLWTIANEYEVHPDGKYRLDLPDDVEWAKAIAQTVKRLDPYGHLVTVHPVVSCNAQGHSPRDPYEKPWRIGEFFGSEPAIDVLSQQTSSAYASRWDDAAGYWAGIGQVGTNHSVAADRVYGKPVLNTENGYEYLRGYPTYRRQVYHTDHVRSAAWRIACAGGFFAAGFAGTQGNGDSFNQSDRPNRYPFVIDDEGAAGQLAVLYECFSNLAFWRMAPYTDFEGDAVVLAEPGKSYVAYLPHGGTVDLGLVKSPAVFGLRWLDPRNGQHREGGTISAAGRCSLVAPDGADWVALLKATAPPR